MYQLCLIVSWCEFCIWWCRMLICKQRMHKYDGCFSKVIYHLGLSGPCAVSNLGTATKIDAFLWDQVDSNMPYLGTIWLAGALACLDSLARTRLSLSWHSCLLFSLAEKETIGTDIIMNKRQDRFPGLPGQSPHCSFIIKFSSLLRCWPGKINNYHFNMEACWWRGL